MPMEMNVHLFFMLISREYKEQEHGLELLS